MPTVWHIVIAIAAGLAAGAGYYRLGLRRLHRRNAAIAEQQNPPPPLPQTRPADPDTVARFADELRKTRIQP